MRPAVSASEKVESICQTILAKVNAQGDAALLALAKEFESLPPQPVRIKPTTEISANFFIYILFI